MTPTPENKSEMPEINPVYIAAKFSRDLVDDGKLGLKSESTFRALVQLITEHAQFKKDKDTWAEQSTLNASRWQESEAKLLATQKRLAEVEREVDRLRDKVIKDGISYRALKQKFDAAINQGKGG